MKLCKALCKPSSGGFWFYYLGYLYSSFNLSLGYFTQFSSYLTLMSHYICPFFIEIKDQPVAQEDISLLKVNIFRFLNQK